MPFRRLFCARWSLHQPSNNHLGGMHAGVCKTAEQQLRDEPRAGAVRASCRPPNSLLLTHGPVLSPSRLVRCQLPALILT